MTALPLAWEIGHVGSDKWLIVPEDRAFDVSVPRGLRWLADPHHPSYLAAAALHDEALLLGWGRGQAGGLFHDALRADGVGRWRSLAMTAAVIAGHPKTWRSDPLTPAAPP